MVLLQIQPLNTLYLRHFDFLMLQARPIPILFSFYHVNPTQEQGFQIIYFKYLNLCPST